MDRIGLDQNRVFRWILVQLNRSGTTTARMHVDKLASRLRALPNSDYKRRMEEVMSKAAESPGTHGLQ